MDPSAPLVPIENSSPTRRRILSSLIPFSSKATKLPNREELTVSTRRKTCEGETKENNNEDAIENMQVMVRSSDTDKKSEMDASNLPNFSNLSPIKKSQRALQDHRDSSFQTQETAPLSDSDQSQSEEESSQETCSSSSSKGVRFADEVGLPIRSILHYNCDRNQREHSELLVLCICPEQKTFEFLHVGYYQQGSDSSLQDLLMALPNMCTNPVFGQSRFVSLYRNSGLSFVNLCDRQSPEESDSHDLLQDCGFRENEVLVAAIDGSSEQQVLASIGPLLGNTNIRKILKRARRSRRGLKFICGENQVEKGSHYHLQKRRQLSLPRKEKKQQKLVEAVANLDCAELVDEYCHDYDPLCDVAEYHKQLLLGILAIGSGTVVFSALGL